MQGATWWADFTKQKPSLLAHQVLWMTFDVVAVLLVLRMNSLRIFYRVVKSPIRNQFGVVQNTTHVCLTLMLGIFIIKACNTCYCQINLYAETKTSIPTIIAYTVLLLWVFGSIGILICDIFFFNPMDWLRFK